jgi:23S rRNA pseudouridine1911/1915/1917 synthase
MINIVYEDNDIIVVNKPAGLLTHKAESSPGEKTLVDFLIEHYPPIKDVGEDLSRPGIVHRLDRETSGLLVAAKTNEAFQYLKNLFQERKVEKKYYALVHGAPKERSGTIDLPLAKLEGKQTTQLEGKQQLEGKTAITEYKTTREFSDYSLLDITIKTGRTHQIRVHLKAIGHPIVCDKIYGSRKAVCPENIKRMFLHAYYLSFVTPSGNPLALEADLPEELAQGLENI